VHVADCPTEKVSRFDCDVLQTGLACAIISLRCFFGIKLKGRHSRTGEALCLMQCLEEHSVTTARLEYPTRTYFLHPSGEKGGKVKRCVVASPQFSSGLVFDEIHWFFALVCARAKSGKLGCSRSAM